jgi:hypothetical protein
MDGRYISLDSNRLPPDDKTRALLLYQRGVCMV